MGSGLRCRKVERAVSGSHAGTCYIIRTSLGMFVTKVHVPMGVRQGSVEGPLCFILQYALSITQAQNKFSVRDSLRWFSRGNTVNRLDLSDLCFVDDLVSLLIFWSKSQLSRFAEMMSQVLESGRLRVNTASWRSWSYFELRGTNSSEHTETSLKSTTAGTQSFFVCWNIFLLMPICFAQVHFSIEPFRRLPAAV